MAKVLSIFVKGKRTDIFLEKDYVEEQHPRDEKGRWSSGGGSEGKTEPFMSTETRFPHAEGSEEHLTTMMARINNVNNPDHKVLVDAFNRGHDYKHADLESNLKGAREYLAGPKGYSKDTDEKGNKLGIVKPTIAYAGEDLKFHSEHPDSRHLQETLDRARDKYGQAAFIHDRGAHQLYVRDKGK